jgi:dihydrofolate reductase
LQKFIREDCSGIDMKVVLYMAITINGLIAKENDDVSFVSAAEWKNFNRMIRKAGNIIIGRRTYDLMRKSSELPKYKNTKIVVVTHKPKKVSGKNIVFTDDSPNEIIKMLRNDGFKIALVAGGGKLNSSFMKAGVVDELYLDLEPTILGKGIKLFADANFEKKLKLVSVKHFSKNEVQLHYKVAK